MPKEEFNPFTGKMDLIEGCSSDYHSGQYNINETSDIVVNKDKQMIVFNELCLEGCLTLNGDLWLS